MNDKNKKQLTEDEERDRQFEIAWRKLPRVEVLPKEWDVPEDDWYDEYYKDLIDDAD